jgi:hypothetical protein
VALKCGSHPFFIAKTAASGAAVDALLGFFQQAPGGFPPEQFDCFGRSAAGLCRAADWLEQVHVDEPLDIAARNTLIDCLWKDEQWGCAPMSFAKTLSAGVKHRDFFTVMRSLSLKRPHPTASQCEQPSPLAVRGKAL